ncbi:MAG TPA: hypothetical protein PKL77_01360 [Candidatus Omnitrophota bacterium]|nr:hypothetical protein [Candidatus Omnitrophota bacterium]HPT07158.1 hypothetical protein [Candidatus Omnitrophota bacterium]
MNMQKKALCSKWSMYVFSGALCAGIITGCFSAFFFHAYAQSDTIEIAFDNNANTVPLPKIFSPNIDLSGRGFHQNVSWPQGMAAPEVLDFWQKDVGFSGMFRVQFNMWEIHELARQSKTQEALMAHYEEEIKRINDNGGIALVSIFGTPAGLGKVLDRRSPPFDEKAFKELLKVYIRRLSCEKRFTVWYELWSAPDLDNFFVGRTQEYLVMYRAFAKAVQELEDDYKIHIPIGGPSTSWWFQKIDGNTVITPERSLIYELIRTSYHYRLPLDFITWHAYSTDPKVELDTTLYHKSSVALIRDWLTYFHFDRATPVIIDEWNFDSGLNVLAERAERSYVTASYIPSRLKRMSEAGVDYAVYYALEDFQANADGVVQNVGVFSFDPALSAYKGAPKATYNVFRMLGMLLGGKVVFPARNQEEFLQYLVTKKGEESAVLIANYIDPDIVNNYLSRSIATLSEGSRRILVNLIRSRTMTQIMKRELTIQQVRPLSRSVRNLLIRALALHDQAQRYMQEDRAVTITIRNIHDTLSMKRYVVDSSCAAGCNFVPLEEEDVAPQAIYKKEFLVKPYSVQLLVFQKKSVAE